MAKKEEKKDLTKPVEVRPQTEDEIRRRLKSQGKLKDEPKKEGEVRELTEDEAMTNIEDRRERLEAEDAEEDENVRPQTKKDIIQNQAARKERAEKDEDDAEKPSRVQTEKDIKDRNEPGPDKDEDGEDETPEKPTDPPEEFYAKDVVTFKNDDGEQVTGKIKRVTSKGEAIIDIEEGDNEYTYTVPCDVLTKVDKEGK